MQTSPNLHQQLLSLGYLTLDGHPLAFSQACICLQPDDAGSWSCSLRGVATEQLDGLVGELSLRARTLDERWIGGRVCMAQPKWKGDARTESIELVGLGSLVVDGRRLC